MNNKGRHAFFLILFAAMLLFLSIPTVMAFDGGGVPNSIEIASFRRVTFFKARIQGSTSFANQPHSFEVALLNQDNAFFLNISQINWLASPCSPGQQCEATWSLKTDLGVPDGEYELIVIARLANGTAVVDQMDVVVGAATGPDCGSGICGD